MSRYKLDTNVAGAFMNIYQPIGDDPVVKCLEDDSDLSEYYAYRRKERLASMPSMPVTST